MNVEFRKVAAVNSEDRDGMFSLMDQHFEHLQREHFDEDLNAKDWVVLVKNAGRVVGFTTVRLYEAVIGGETATVVYSGDTLVNPEYRMNPAFVKGWFASMQYLQKANKGRKLYWLLLCSGFRTYRFMPVYWKTYFPRYDMPTPDAWAREIDVMASSIFGDGYDKRTGIVTLTRPQVLREQIRDIPDGRQKDPRIQFFCERNPGHEKGDELVCLTHIDYENLTAAGRRYWEPGDLSFRVVHESDQ